MKMMKLLVAMLVVAGLVVPAIAVAEDRLSLSGEMRVRGWHDDTDFDDDLTDDDTNTFADQRMRIGGKIAVAEGVSVTFRMDATESRWGTGNAHGSGRIPADSSSMQWDRAHLDLTKGMWHLRAGQQYLSLGEVTAVDTQDNGLAMDFKTAVPVKVFGFLNDDNGADSDAFLFGISTKPTLTVNLASEFFAVGQTKTTNADEEAYVFGAALAFLMDPIKLVGELDVFTGDANATQDAMGTQFYLDASMAATPAVRVGGQFYYALAADDDGSEVQYVSLGSQFGGWDPIFDVGTNLDNEQIGLGKPFDFSGMNAGVVGGRLYASSKMSDTVGLGASIAYLTTEDDGIWDANQTAFAAGVTYAIMSNASLQAQVEYVDGEADVDGDFDAFRAGTGIFVKF